jgi:CheY-like chemotaxis protein
VVRICILEDYPPLSRVLAVTLQRVGCQVTPAQPACEVLQAVDTCAYDALLVDMDRATEESWRALQRLSNPSHPLPIVVLLSPGHGEWPELDAYGVHVVLLKPVSRDALLRGIMLAIQETGREP